MGTMFTAHRDASIHVVKAGGLREAIAITAVDGDAFRVNADTIGNNTFDFDDGIVARRRSGSDTDFAVAFPDGNPLPWLRACTPMITRSVTTTCPDVSAYWALLEAAGAVSNDFRLSQQRFDRDIEAYHRNQLALDESRLDWFEWDEDRLVGHIALYRYSPLSYGLFDIARLRSSIRQKQEGLVDVFFSLTSTAIASTDTYTTLAGSWKRGHPKWRKLESRLQLIAGEGANVSKIPTSYRRGSANEECAQVDFGEITVYQARSIIEGEQSQFELLVRSYLPLHGAVRECRAALVFADVEYLLVAPRLPHGYTLLRTAEIPWAIPLSGPVTSWEQIVPSARYVCEQLGHDWLGLFVPSDAPLADSTSFMDFYLAPPIAFDYAGS